MGLPRLPGRTRDRAREPTAALAVSRAPAAARHRRGDRSATGALERAGRSSSARSRSAVSTSAGTLRTASARQHRSPNDSVRPPRSERLAPANSSSCSGRGSMLTAAARSWHARVTSTSTSTSVPMTPARLTVPKRRGGATRPRLLGAGFVRGRGPRPRTHRGRSLGGCGGATLGQQPSTCQTTDDERRRSFHTGTVAAQWCSFPAVARTPRGKLFRGDTDPVDRHVRQRQVDGHQGTRGPWASSRRYGRSHSWAVRVSRARWLGVRVVSA